MAPDKKSHTEGAKAYSMDMGKYTKERPKEGPIYKKKIAKVKSDIRMQRSEAELMKAVEGRETTKSKFDRAKILKSSLHLKANEVSKKELNSKIKGIKEKNPTLSKEELESKALDQMTDELGENRRDNLVQKRIKDNDEKKPLISASGMPLKDAKGNPILESRFEKVQKEYPNIGKMVEQLPELSKELLAVYGEKKLDSYGMYLKDIKAEDMPKTLVEFDKFLTKKIAEDKHATNAGDVEAAKEEGNTGEKGLTEEQKKQQVENTKNDPALMKALASSGNEKSIGKLEGGNDVANNALLDKAIENCKIPARKKLLLSLKKELGKTEKNNPNDIKGYHKKAGLNAGPSTSWCMSFVQAQLSDNGLEHHKTARARDGLVMGRDVGKEPKPGDLVIVARKGKDSAGNPGGHIGFYLGKDSSGNPIILGGNQSNSVSVKTERRPVLGYRSVIPEAQDKKTETKET